MYCPNCGTQNIEGASFCRACGANLSLVPQALTGHLPESVASGGEEGGRKGKKQDKQPSIEKAITNIFLGIGFLFVSFAVMRFAPAGRIWWFWMLIPAFSLLGGGVAEFVRFRLSQSAAQRPQDLPAYSPPASAPGMPPAASALPPRRNTSELYAPGSVTEGTTRLLEHEPQTRLFDSAVPAERRKED